MHVQSASYPEGIDLYIGLEERTMYGSSALLRTPTTCNVQDAVVAKQDY